MYIYIYLECSTQENKINLKSHELLKALMCLHLVRFPFIIIRKYIFASSKRIEKHPIYKNACRVFFVILSFRFADLKQDRNQYSLNFFLK